MYGQTYHCWKKKGHGYMNLRNAIKQSCDTYFYEAARKLGVDRLNQTGLKFGLGNDRFTGYDTDGTDHRLYVGWKFGKIGFGHDGTNPEYTIGANYYILDNIGLDLDFIMGDNNENNIRLSLNINFP